MGFPTKRYIGDAVYVDYISESERLILTTEDGRDITNTIILEPQIYNNLLDFVEEVIDAKEGKV